ncbi:phosphoenolpyruvate carboxykinase (ATP) [Longibacter salinarum]|uniref:Phosphoenolpyruvate carboxykinase (ATP) n=1 Tax=Longibacter salinarum TaxID=1850348 RepID=A0A2A8CZS9_9BACT|nr:phosphoenolpyruvate carboxykinase (ATP) [Longibacter salinarum]PEN14229.1 phosphoenolpyruvate carboxykinase (ATP) [Longibacter salinarum]
MPDINLSAHGIDVKDVLRNATPAQLYEEAIRVDSSAQITRSGALRIASGEKTGRSPADKRIVRHPESEDEIWWGPINMEIDTHTFRINRERAQDYLNICDRLYVIDGFAGWDPNHRLKARIICSRPYHALFMHNMLIRPEREELENFGEPDFVIYNAGAFPANRQTQHMTSKTSVDVSFEDSEMVILGTEYAGEMKKGIFTVMHYLMPERGVLSMHCSANEGEDGDVSLFFGLSGTGKTTLSADPNRKLIGDDEHGWSDEGVFNIEGGCYAKAIDLSAEKEPEIYQAIRYGTVLENVVVDKASREVDYSDTSITQNTRASYPLNYIPNAKLPAVGDHPSNIIFLTYDAFGVMPPVAKLTPEQAMYHFISGYTAKVAGTEVGVTEPKATFSAAFGAAFLVRHPSVYAEMLAEKMREHGSNAWIVNTGITGGPYGTGHRMPLPHTRSIIDAIHDGALSKAETTRDPVFGFDVPLDCPNVPAEILQPRETWDNPAAYDEQAQKLVGLFRDHFKQYEDVAGAEIAEAGPTLEPANA